MPLYFQYEQPVRLKLSDFNNYLLTNIKTSKIIDKFIKKQGSFLDLAFAFCTVNTLMLAFTTLMSAEHFKNSPYVFLPVLLMIILCHFTLSFARHNPKSIHPIFYKLNNSLEIKKHMKDFFNQKDNIIALSTFANHMLPQDADPYRVQLCEIINKMSYCEIEDITKSDIEFFIKKHKSMIAAQEQLKQYDSDREKIEAIKNISQHSLVPDIAKLQKETEFNFVKK